jgi:hypothetical protein
MTDSISAHVPMAARKQIKEANRLFKEANTSQPATPAEPAPTAQPIAATPAPAAPVVQQQDDPVKLVEHKYSVLQGKYNAETNRLTGQVQALMAENQRLLTAATAAPPAGAPARREDQFDLSVVTPKEREEFGEELVQMMARIAAANSAGEVASLKKELATMRGQVQQNTQVVASTAMERIWSQLDNNIQNWRTINISQQFVDWLQVLDVMSGKSRQVGLTQAFESGDGPRVVGIFKRFEEDSQARSTPTAPAPQLDQGTLIAPGSPRGSGGEAPNGTNKRVFSEQEIDDFYSRVQRGRIGADEKKALEAELQEAVRDGRVIPRHDTRHLSNRN